MEDTARRAGRVNLLGLDEAALRRWLEADGERPFRARQLLGWIHRRGVDDFACMTDLSKALRARLAETACVAAPRVLGTAVSADGTRKWLLGLDDPAGGPGNVVEMVFIPEPNRGTLCVSSQVGCSLDCAFCATARQGFNRNLTSAEIVGQLWLARRLLAEAGLEPGAITNVVLMGMGEPLLNLREVLPALNLMVSDHAYGLSKRRVTVSTAGVVPMIDRLREHSEVSLAVSLHAPDDALRDELVPINRRFPLAELMAACRRYVAGRARRRVTFEYVMLDGVNDRPEHARALGRLLRGLPCKLNLIPFNPFPGSGYRCSSAHAIERFAETLRARGHVVTVRKTRGQDIDAACGQLAGRVQDRSARHLRFAAPRYGERRPEAGAKAPL
ncbi:MAG: dual-specificity RNA methyltransferase RlmN [Gammaproteobacteria bacterium]|nr:MAG: dual-specificity RNA methyltransferase RlmN [Gammaproteobacteria bacterium]